MAKQRYINTRFWDDGYIVTLDPIEKLLFIYFLTNPLTEICGAYEIPLRRIAFDTGIDSDMVLKMVRRFADADKIIYRDGWVLVCNFIKHQASNPKIEKGIETAVNGCPDWIKDRLSIAYDSLSPLNPNSNTNRIEFNRDDTPHESANFDYPVKDLIDAFPNLSFQPNQIGFIQATVLDTPADREAWSSTLTTYIQNYDPFLKSYVPTRTGTLLDIFKQRRAEIIKNGTNRNNNFSAKPTPGQLIANRPYRTTDSA